MNRVEKLYIDSRDRNTNESSSDFTVYISNFRELIGVKSVYVDSMVFPNSILPINAKNNKLYLNMRRYSALTYLTWTDQPFVVELPIGSYTPQEMIDTLNPLIVTYYNVAYPSNPQTLTTSMSYNTKSSVFSITVTSQYGRASTSQPGGTAIDYLVIDDKNSTNYANNYYDSLNYVLGFEDMSYSYPTNIQPYLNTPIQIAMSSTSLHHLSGEQYLYLHSDIVSTSETSTKDTSTNDVLYKINLAGSYSEIIYSSTPHSASQINVNTQSAITKIRFYLTDSRNEPVDMRGGEWSFILSLTYE